jgi:hypothetical protein
MTVEELIANLHEYDPQAEVMLSVLRPNDQNHMVNVAEDIHSTELATITHEGWHWLVGEPDDPDETPEEDVRQVVIIG